MSLSAISDVREIGNLPPVAKLADAVIAPHLAAAGRELASWIGDYSGSTGDKLADCKEAECCICMAYLLPVLNTLYTQGVTTLQRELGSLDIMFSSPDDQKTLVEMWLDRAHSRVTSYINTGSARRPLGFYAI